MRCARLLEEEAQRGSSSVAIKIENTKRALFVISNIKCGQKIHGHLDIPKFDSIVSHLPDLIVTYIQGSQLQKDNRFCLWLN